MYRATTPEHTFTLPQNANTYDIIQVAYRQKKTTLIKQYEDGVLPEGMTLNGKDVVITLTQEETKAFKSGVAEAQVRVLTSGGSAFASDIFKISIHDVINEEVLNAD